MNIGVHAFFQISVFGDIYPGVELLFLVFKGTSVLFPIVTAPIYILTNDVEEFPFLHILYNICYL